MTPVDPRFIVTAHVLSLANFEVVPTAAYVDVPGDVYGVSIGPTDIAKGRLAAVISLLHGNRPSSATPQWTVSRVILNEAAAMRNRLARTVPRLVAVFERMHDLGRIPEPESNSLEDAMLFAIAVSKIAEVGASAFRIAESFHPEQAQRLRNTYPDGVERMLTQARLLDPKGHKQNE